MVNVALGIAAWKYEALHQGHEVRTRLDERGLTLLCVDCFELITFYPTQPGGLENNGQPELRAAYFRGGSVKDVPVWLFFSEVEQAEAESEGAHEE